MTKRLLPDSDWFHHRNDRGGRPDSTLSDQGSRLSILCSEISGKTNRRIGPPRCYQENAIASPSQRLCARSGTSDHRHTISDLMSLPCLCNVSVHRRTSLPSDKELVSADGIDQQGEPKENELVIHRSNVPTHSKYLCATKATDSGRGVSSPLSSPSNTGTVGVRRTGSFSLSSCESNKAKRIGVLNAIKCSIYRWILHCHPTHCDSGERKLDNASA